MIGGGFQLADDDRRIDDIHERMQRFRIRQAWQAYADGLALARRYRWHHHVLGFIKQGMLYLWALATEPGQVDAGMGREVRVGDQQMKGIQGALGDRQQLLEGLHRCDAVVAQVIEHFFDLHHLSMVLIGDEDSHFLIRHHR
ncbi:hypothetical protein D3C76_1033930 [compost metagenome]